MSLQAPAVLDVSRYNRDWGLQAKERTRSAQASDTGEAMSDTATLSQLFTSIEDDVRVVDRSFQEHAGSDLEMLNAAVIHVLSSRGKKLRTALTLLSGKLIDYRFEKLLPLAVALEMVHLATLVHDD